MMNMQKKLKPIVTTTNKYKHNAKSNTEQLVLLKALQVTQDPKKLRQMMGVKTVAEVYRTIDKLSIRKEYHDALASNGFSLDTIVKGIQVIAESSEKDDTKLKAYQTILKSVGLDRYDASDAPTGGTWEEELTKSIEKQKELPEGEVQEMAKAEYAVEEVDIPPEMKKLREEEDELTKNVYGE